jgi:hypothetical protein
MSKIYSLAVESSSVAIGSRTDTRPIWVNGPDTVVTNEGVLPLNDLFDPLPSRGGASAAPETLEVQQPVYTAIGSNGHPMHGVRFQPHHQHSKPNAGAPSIAGISDVSQSTGHHSRDTATIKNSTPTLIGFGHASDVVLVFDGKLQIGSTTVHADGTWVFTSPSLLNGRHDFFVGVIDPVNGGTLTSNHLAVQVFAEVHPSPTAIATITSALDEFADPSGNHHDNVIQNGGKTADTSPQLHGTISTALHEGEVLAIYRDGQQIGTASVTGLGWSFQDAGLTTGQHVYMASVISATGEQGVRSEDFVITERAGTGNSFEIFGTEDFLIFDTRLVSRTFYDGRPASFDLLETVKNFEEAGMTVKSYTDNGGIISIEVDWVAFIKAHPNADPQLVTHSHVDNDKGGLNYYNVISIPTFGYLLEKLGTWTYAGYPSDSPQSHPGTPAPATTIMGIYDVYTDASGNPGQSLVPDGGSTASSTHKIVFTFSEPLDRSLLGDHWEIYRDGVRLLPRDLLESKYDQATNIGSAIDTNVPPGPHVYTMRVPRMFGDQGAWSESYSIVETGPAPVVVATITSALDEFADPSGNHHDTVIQNGGKTFDTSPKLLGTLSAAMDSADVLVVYRDGVTLGHADVSGLGWSFQDTGVTTGEHTYTARVESASGVRGTVSDNFTIEEATPQSFGGLPMMLTDNFLIFDTRGISRTTSDGSPISFDLLEGVKSLEANGLPVKSYTDKDGIISIEADWMPYVKANPDSLSVFDFVSHRHVDNDKGGLDYYDVVGTPLFSPYQNVLNTWIPMSAVADGRVQPAVPPAATFITGIYDVYTDGSGKPVESLIPEGGSTANSTHKIVLTFSEPLGTGWNSESWFIYRDDVRLASDGIKRAIGYDPATNTGWVIDTDVPPGAHTYTARVERMYGEQGAWSESYGIASPGSDPLPETLSARLMLTDAALLLDVQSLTPAKDGSSVAAMGLSAELTVGGEHVALLPAVTDANGLVSVNADWKALAAEHPGATLTISAHTGPNNPIEILDKHTLTSLLGQTDRWVSMTSTGENAAFFDASDRGVHIHGNTDVNTIFIANDHQLLDLTSLTGKTIGSTIMGIEKIDLGGQHNTLKIAMIDVLNLGETDLFRIDGKQQLMVNGKEGDSVKLSNTRVAGIADGEWEQQAETKVGGVTYDVYEHSTAHVELMVQSGIQLTIH